MFFQNGLTGEAWGDWALYTDSPLRALTPAQESIAGTGGPFPENFWDPAGITKGKSDWERTFITHVVAQLYLAELPKVISWMAFWCNTSVTPWENRFGEILSDLSNSSDKPLS